MPTIIHTAFQTNAAIPSSANYILGNKISLSRSANIRFIYYIDFTINNYAALDLIDNYSNIDDLLELDSATSPNKLRYDVKLHIATSEDDITYSSYKELIMGSLYSGRYFKFKLIVNALEILPTSHYIIINTVKIVATSFDRQESGSVALGSTSDSTTTSVTYSKPFLSTPQVTITRVNGNANETTTISSSSATGFSFRSYVGVDGIQRAVDWIAKGY